MYILATVSSLSSVNAQAQKTIKPHTRDQQTWKQQIYPQGEGTSGSSVSDWYSTNESKALCGKPYAWS